MKPAVFVLVGAFLLPGPSSLAAQCPVGSTGAGGTPLLIRLKEGESRRSLVTTDNTTSQSLMGQQQESHQVTSMVVRYEVERPRTDARRRIRITYDSMHVEMTTPMASFVWDSGDTTEAPPPGAQTFSALVGRGYTISMAADGSDRHVEGWDSIVDAMLTAVDLPPGVNMDETRKMLKDMVGDQVMSSALGSAVTAIPGRLVNVGDSWSCTSSMSAPMSLSQTATWTVNGRKGGVSTVGVTSEMASDSAAAMSVGPMSMHYALKGSGTGTLEIEDATGWVVRSRMESKMSGTATMEGSPMGTMKIPMNITTVTTTEPIS